MVAHSRELTISAFEVSTFVILCKKFPIKSMPTEPSSDSSEQGGQLTRLFSLEWQWKTRMYLSFHTTIVLSTGIVHPSELGLKTYPRVALERQMWFSDIMYLLYILQLPQTVILWGSSRHNTWKGRLRANAMKRVAAGAHLPTPWVFEPARNAQTIEPTTVWTSVFGSD